jgi:ATP-binding cassette subfamily C (CFTR/MRP) protein 1
MLTLYRFSQDMRMIDRELPSSMMGMSMRNNPVCRFGTMLTSFLEGFKIAAQGFLIFGGDAFMFTSIPFCIVVIYFLQKIYLLTSRQIRFLDLESRSPVYSQFLETVSSSLEKLIEC